MTSIISQLHQHRFYKASVYTHTPLLTLPHLTYSSAPGWAGISGIGIPDGSTLCKRIDLRRTVSSSAFLGLALEQLKHFKITNTVK